MKTLPLSQGLVAVVDDEDYERVGRFKWSANKIGRCTYAVRVFMAGGRQNTVHLHRFLLNAPKGMEVDHIDGDGLNNTRANIRVVTKAQNRQNRIKNPDAGNPYKGVYRSGPSWEAACWENRKKKHLGTFKDAETAARAYDAAALRLYGEHACLNFPPPGGRSAVISSEGCHDPASGSREAPPLC